jgi:hypothetical protein
VSVVHENCCKPILTIVNNKRERERVTLCYFFPTFWFSFRYPCFVVFFLELHIACWDVAVRSETLHWYCTCISWTLYNSGRTHFSHLVYGLLCFAHWCVWWTDMKYSSVETWWEGWRVCVTSLPGTTRSATSEVSANTPEGWYLVWRCWLPQGYQHTRFTANRAGLDMIIHPS